jgi:acetyl-CoA carboxylase biotin carboxyl carrier protein
MVKNMVKNKSNHEQNLEENNYNSIKKLAKILTDENLTEIEYQNNEIKIRVSRSRTGIAENSLAAAPLQSTDNTKNNNNEESKLQSHLGAIKSPMVGVAYLSPEPGSTPFVTVGDKVKKGQTLILIEAMKTFNPVQAPSDGILKSMHVSDGQPLEFAQLIAVLGN